MLINLYFFHYFQVDIGMVVLYIMEEVDGAMEVMTTAITDGIMDTTHNHEN